MAIASNIPGMRFGIKEVADVHFYNVNSTVNTLEDAISIYESAEPVISFDTLKVSNIETTAEKSEARGGKGNAALISWDYGREITVTLEDALLSMETLSLLFENSVNNVDGTIKINANTFPGTYAVIGTTYARNESDGVDHIFKFVIPKAKIQSETTLTMEAEGDPTVIGMTLKVLRTKSGDMMGLVHDGYKAQGGIKVLVNLVSADGTIVSKMLEAGSEWPTEIQGNYKDLPTKVAPGTYYVSDN